MQKSIKRITAGIMTLAVAASMSVMSAFAAGPYTEGDYTGKVAFLHEKQDKASMCNVLFDHDADVVVKGDQAEIKFYAAYPVPAFPDAAPDGTLKDMVMTLDGTEYTAVSDITTQPERVMDETNEGFKVEAGKAIPTQVLTFTIPAAKLDSMTAGAVPAKAFVNAIMGMNVNFRIQLSDVKAEAAPVDPTETTQKSMNVTADVAAPAATYTVTIPESITMGTLSAEKDNVVGYNVEVTAQNMGEGYVQVSTDAAGALTSGENKLAFSNDFGTQTANANTTLKGNFTVKAADVQAAAAGNYTGTANFSISYFAGK